MHREREFECLECWRVRAEQEVGSHRAVKTNENDSGPSKNTDVQYTVLSGLGRGALKMLPPSISYSP